MADIFISYAKKDRSRVEPLAKALEAQSLTVWWDPIIPAGKDFDDVIEEELSKARCVIVIWTKSSVKSKYVKGEAREALNRGILVPIEIESGIKPPFDFRSIQTLSLINWDGSDNFPGFQKLITDVISILSEPPTKVKLPEPKPDTTSITESKSPELRKTNNALKFGAVAGVIMLLIGGIWWWVSQQKEKELIAARKAKIFVASAPDNATIKILNIDEPFQQGMELQPGKYHVHVSSEEYEPQGRWIELNPGEEKRINFKLEKITPKVARLFVETVPEDAIVRILYIKPKFVQGMELEPGSYHVEVAAEEYETERRWIDLVAGHKKPFRFELAKIRDAAPGGLIVVSFGGSISQGQIEAFQKPFMKKTGITINAEVYNGGLDKIRAQALSRSVDWDVVNLEKQDLSVACDEGLIEPIDWSILSPAPDGTQVEKDFIPGALHKCGVATSVWATIIAYDKTKYAGDSPSKLADFFDIKKFPGMRAISNRPVGTLELALMADGVPAEEVYKTLSTNEGVDRAFKKLDTIKKSLIFWGASAQPVQMLADGDVIMTTAYNNRIFNAQIKKEKPFVIIWDHQIYGMDYYSILKGTKNRQSALQYIKFATTSHALADQASWAPYGPTRKSSIPLVKTYHGTDVKMAPHLPTSPENFTNGLAIDYEWWAEKQDLLLNRFKIWMLK